MARMRTIKPTFWTNPDVVKCSLGAQLLYVGLWNFADDQGVHPADCISARLEVFPARSDVKLKEVARWVQELSAHRLLEVFEHGGQRYWWITLWHEQTIEKPRFRYPAPPNAKTSKRRIRVINIVTEEGK